MNGKGLLILLIQNEKVPPEAERNHQQYEYKEPDYIAMTLFHPHLV